MQPAGPFLSSPRHPIGRAMDPVPAYLLWYLLRIRRHSGEPGYLVERAKSLDVEVATYEASMLREMQELHLVGLSDDEDVSLPDGYGNRCYVKFPRDFVMLARGHYAWVEPVFGGARWLVAALLGALIAHYLGA